MSAASASTLSRVIALKVKDYVVSVGKGHETIVTPLQEHTETCAAYVKSIQIAIVNMRHILHTEVVDTAVGEADPTLFSIP